MTATTTNLDELMDDDVFTLGCEPLKDRRGRPALKADPEARRFNEALWRIVNGKPDIGGLTHELSVLTGLSMDTIRDRIADIEYAPEPLEPGTGLTNDDWKYFGKNYKNHKSAEVRDFYQKITGGQRRHPDREDARVSRQRINGRLISLAIHTSSN